MFAGWAIGLVKLAEAAIATAINSDSGARPAPAATSSAIGAISTTNAAVGMIVVATAVTK